MYRHHHDCHHWFALNGVEMKVRAIWIDKSIGKFIQDIGFWLCELECMHFLEYAQIAYWLSTRRTSSTNRWEYTIMRVLNCMYMQEYGFWFPNLMEFVNGWEVKGARWGNPYDDMLKILTSSHCFIIVYYSCVLTYVWV